MENSSLYSILFLTVFGIVSGYFIARNTHKREVIHSGAFASAGNYVASALLISIAPTVLCTLFFIQPTFLGESVVVPGVGWEVTELAHAVLIAVVMILLALIALIPYGILEKPHIERLAQEADRGWTREDAEASGL